MNRFNMWMQRIMYGRYGNDCLNKFLLIVALVMILLGCFWHNYMLRLSTVVILILAYCRMFSRNHYARSKENQKFMDMTSRFRGDRGNCGSYRSGTSYSGSTTWSAGPQKDKSHKILRCPGCGQKLRVPKGVGKINITCPYCQTKFIKKV